ncbi:hypothetical protein [Streptomyces sp. NPDC005385]|uniref:hypothetical protein n=1 Tax=Streptomyces sp. NPDC005385 TaxID=3157039 RepID=UPI0033BAAAF2
MAANDPAAVLRRITADRKLLELHMHVDCEEFGCDCHSCCRTCRWTEAEEEGVEVVWGDVTRHVYPCPSMRFLAEGHGWTAVTPMGNS